MSDILDSMNSSPAMRGVPRQGASISVASPDADIAALLEQITSADPLADLEPSSYDKASETAADVDIEVDDPDVIEDLDEIVRQMPESISDPATAKPKPQVTPITATVSDDEDDLVDSDDLDSTEEDSNGGSKFKKTLIAGVVVVVIIILAVLLSRVTKKSETTTTQEQPAQSGAVAQSTFYADQLAISDTTTYQDSMVIEKYIVLDQDACIFVFKGYAENARAFVTAYVDIDTYNRYKTGARVPILYERLSINGDDYYMKVRLNV